MAWVCVFDKYGYLLLIVIGNYSFFCCCFYLVVAFGKCLVPVPLLKRQQNRVEGEIYHVRLFFLVMYFERLQKKKCKHAVRCIVNIT